MRAVLLWLLLLLPGFAHADPDALWRIVHGQCVPDMQRTGSPAPCAEVDLKGGTVLLKDRVGVAQYLLMPTAKVTGIEDPVILAPDAPNYFAAAWAGRGETEARLHHTLPREAVSLAINSVHGRTQNQLHIHIDCLRADIRARLAAASIGPAWSPLPLAGHAYRAMHLPGDALAANPFRLLGHPPDMANHTLVVVGAPGGFTVLDYAADGASGEELQDHACTGS